MSCNAEVRLRVAARKMELTTIAAAKWDRVPRNSAKFREERASIVAGTRKVVDIFNEYAAVME